MKKNVLSLLGLVIGFFCIVFYFNACVSEKGQVAKTSQGSVNQVVPDVVSFNFHVKPILSDRCFKCHGPDETKMEGGLGLDTKERAFAALGKAKDHFAIVPGDVEASVLVKRIYSEDPDEVMPPTASNLQLSNTEKAILKKWIAQGAEWKQHWSFIPPSKSEIPVINNKEWAKNEIDFFILNRLEQEGFSPSQEADEEMLLRRLSFDLTGLPPTLEELDAFIANKSPDDYEKEVDRLLQTDAYAEHMAAQWLDIARYADTHGYQDDLERVMWPWRDWVIHAYKKNLPYDDFITWQLAGDLLPNPTLEQIIATAFNRNHKITQEGGVIPEEYRVEYVADRAQTFSTAFLGLTMECARCHDHKYDPLSQKNYFELFSFFNNVPENGLIQPYGAIPKPYIMLQQSEIDNIVTFVNNADTLDEIPLMVMEEMEEPRQAYILNRGLYDQPADPVYPNTPESVGAFTDDYDKNRLGLAKWLLAEDNALFARVAVNRFWQQLFGRGIVSTTEDFGNQGALPSHPELLDYLAIKFREEAWDVKAILKYIVLSSTYRQSAKVTPELLEKDPENDLLARAPRLRLSAEMIRDHVLTASGLLVRTVGGPSVKPYQPPGLWAEKTGGGGGSTAQYIPDTGKDLYRRSIYTFWKRTVPPPSMMTFDAASRDFCAVRRQSTSTPLQALVLMNDPQVLEASRVMAYRAIENGEGLESAINQMFRRTTSRHPSPQELQVLVDYYQEELTHFEQNPAAANAFLSVGEHEQNSILPPAEMAAYAMVANAIFNLDESINKS